MITEHYYERIYLLEIDTMNGSRFLDRLCRPTVSEEDAFPFLESMDAKRYGQKHYGGLFHVIPIDFVFRVEYDVIASNDSWNKTFDCWQKKRTYRTMDDALKGYDDYIANARGTWSGIHTWRLVDLRTNEVIRETVPDTQDLSEKESI